MKAKDIMKVPCSIWYKKTLIEALMIMQDENINSLLVVDNDWYLKWIVSINSILADILPAYINISDDSTTRLITDRMLEKFMIASWEMKIKNFLRNSRSTIRENSNVWKIMFLFLNTKFPILPVVDKDNKVVWVISREWIRTILFKNCLDCKK